MSRSTLRDAVFDVATLHWEHGPTPIQCVFRRGRRGWEPWVVVAESAIMRRAGKTGLGLYAARSFRRDEYVGRYDGKIVGEYATRDEALASTACKRLVRRGKDKLITRRRREGPGVELVDGADGPPPFLHRINDPRGSGKRSNVDLTPGGWIRIRQRRVPAFDIDRGVDDNIDAELRFSYGDDYWNLISHVGGAQLPVTLDSDSE